MVYPLNFNKFSQSDVTIAWSGKKKSEIEGYSNYLFTPFKFSNITDFINSSEMFFYSALKVAKSKRKKVYFTKCSDRTLTTAGWAFVTPFSSNPKYTGYGSQDILIVSVIFAGISTTISFTNLLITKRTLAMPGFRNRRSLLPFITISLLLTMRMLAVVTPVLGASMFMLLMDRH